MTSLIKNLVGLTACQSLVMQMNGQAGQFTQLTRKLTSTQGLAARFTGEMQRVANNNASYGILPSQARNGTQILSGVGPTDQCHYRVRRDF